MRARDGRILEPLDQLGVAAVVRPRRHERRQLVEPGGIGIGVRGDVDAGGARRSMRATISGIRPKLLFAARLQVPDLDRDVRLAADADRLLERGVMIASAPSACGSRRCRRTRAAARDSAISSSVLAYGAGAYSSELETPDRALLHRLAQRAPASARAPPRSPRRSASPITISRTVVAPT